MHTISLRYLLCCDDVLLSNETLYNLCDAIARNVEGILGQIEILVWNMKVKKE